MHKVKEGKYGWQIFFKHFILELHLFKFSLAITIKRGYFHLAFPLLFSVYITDKGDTDFGKELSLSVFNGGIFWNIWTDGLIFNSKTPQYRRGSWYPLDTILGNRKYSSRVIEERSMLIPMPEKSYEATIQLCEDTWKRPRWFAKTITRIDAKIPEGIPHEGKGENEWDSGGDRTYGMCCPAKDIFDGVGKIVADCLRTRVRHGGWKDYKWVKEATK